MVRSRIPDPRAFFFPSEPPDSKMFCMRAAMLFSISVVDWTDSAKVVSLHRERGG